MKKYKLALLCMISGILMALPWFEYFSGIILFVALIPLLFVEDYISKNLEKFKRRALLRYSSITFIIWISFSGWWVKNASFVGMLFIVITTFILMLITFGLFHFTKRNLGPKPGYFALIIYWITFEYFYLNAEISFPWLTLGNGFAKDIKFIQWYEYTGTLGGTFWILFVNILIYNIISGYLLTRSIKTKIYELVILLLTIGLPIMLSVVRYNTYKVDGSPVTIISVQPNVDPYEKFVEYTTEMQTDLIIKNAQPLLDKNVDYIIAPETAITNYANIDNMEADKSIQTLRNFIKPYPDLKIITGVFLRKYYENIEDATETASEMGRSGLYYDTFNSAIQLDSSDNIQYYHKSLLFVGVEKMPYPEKLQLLKKLTLKLGGTFRSLATQKERTTLDSQDSSIRIGAVICWENVFGEFVTGYIKSGANLLIVITNEGWWGDTPGYKVLNHYSQLRAIETRRSIARSANTGISSFINQRGEVLDMIGWWKEGAIKTTLHTNDNITFYTQHGDFMGRISRLFSLLIFLMAILAAIMRKGKRRTSPK
ncbi:MAG: apolipoprotein N-acyltransferase [Bacteroidales bacterium]|nr:apolipoprotein N-acyltransferase [Bacteroidales bacterium]